jgi:WD40 repeat protein
VEVATADLTGRPNWLQFSPDGRTVVSANRDGTLTLWDMASATSRERFHGHSTSVLQLVFSPDGETLYTVSGGGTAIAWGLKGNRGVKRPFVFTHDRDFDEAYDGHPGRFSPDGRLIAVGLKGRGIALIDTSDLSAAGARLLKTGELGGEVKALAFSPDGTTLAAVTGLGETTIWDVESRSLRRAFYVSPGFLVGVGFSADGTRLATTGGLGVAFSDVATGASLGGIATRSSSSDVSFSADGALVGIANSRVPVPRAQVWDVAKRSRVAAVEGDAQGTALSVALSPDGRILAVGGYGRAVTLWDVGTRTVVHELDHRGAGAMTLEFSRDGRILAVSGFYEPVASLWDVATGTQIGPNLTAGSRTAMMDLSSDGRRLLMTNADGHGAVWDIDPESWARRSCALANRTLTREEWETFLPGRPYEPACTT